VKGVGPFPGIGELRLKERIASIEGRFGEAIQIRNDLRTLREQAEADLRRRVESLVRARENRLSIDYKKKHASLTFKVSNK
jgi:hypothetical protein